ncbi:uncharacterized protein LOC135502220 [Lineus longissimus]|uniref:uncharacterized protein LOC135502220 n=1 Tax=Lineus longissimus TaxID=88925 RepID=UPI002B4C9178
MVMGCCGFSSVVFIISVGYTLGISKDSEVAIGQFQGIADEYYNWLNAANPDYAFSRGIFDNMSHTERMSIAKLEERKVKFEDFLTRLENIDMHLLPHRTQVSYLVLEQALRTVVSFHGFIKYGYNVVALNQFNGLQNQFARLPLNTKQDFMAYIERVRSLAGTVDDMRQLMEEALRYKMVLNAISIAKNHSKVEVEDTNIYRTFEIGLDYSGLPPKDSEGLLRQLYDALNRTLLPANNNLNTFMLEQYRPRARPCDGLWCLENGTALYQAHLQYYLSINVTPEYIHQLGLREVKRIKGEMKKLFNKMGFNGTMKEFFEGLKTNASLVYTNESDLFNHVKNLVYNKIEPALLKVFKKESIPTLPLKVVEMKGYGPFGYYRRGTMYSSFVINVKEPEKKPVINLLPLALHEGLPGHHMQIGPGSNLANLPNFRRYKFYSHFPTTPAYMPRNAATTEGWALYAEKLGYEMGLYETPYDALGQLELELFRACRLVIDSGLHAKKWTRQKALDYLVEHSCMPLASLEFEIDRYIRLPGQACAYKVGEIRLLELRERARKILGPKFDLKEFHHAVLSAGSRIPLDVYDHVINRWINQTLSSSSASVHVTISVYWTLFIFCVFGVVFY